MWRQLKAISILNFIHMHTIISPYKWGCVWWLWHWLLYLDIGCSTLTLAALPWHWLLYLDIGCSTLTLAAWLSSHTIVNRFLFAYILLTMVQILLHSSFSLPKSRIPGDSHQSCTSCVIKTSTLPLITFKIVYPTIFLYKTVLYCNAFTLWY